MSDEEVRSALGADKMVARLHVDKLDSREHDPRSAARRKLDQHRETVLFVYTTRRSWPRISRLLARILGVYSADGRPLDARRLEKLVERTRMLKGLPDPAAPDHAQITTSWCPVPSATVRSRNRGRS